MDENGKGLKEITVLDHGYVRYVDSMGDDASIVAAARMSTGKGFLGWGPKCVHCKQEVTLALAHADPTAMKCPKCGTVDTEPGDEKLLEFLYKNQHHTPFEMCEMAIEAYWPIMVGREAMRHRVFSFNEFSARYAQMPNEHYVPAPERFVTKLTGNKQESSAYSPEMQKDIGNICGDAIHDVQQELYKQYEDMINEGVPKEIARINTPVSRYTRVRMKGDIRGWLGFLKLRLDPAAQWEIRQYAQAIAEIVKDLWPRTYALFEEHTLGSVTLSRSEAKLAAKWISVPAISTPSRDAVALLHARLERE